MMAHMFLNIELIIELHIAKTGDPNELRNCHIPSFACYSQILLATHPPSHPIFLSLSVTLQVVTLFYFLFLNSHSNSFSSLSPYIITLSPLLSLHNITYSLYYFHLLFHFFILSFYLHLPKWLLFVLSNNNTSFILLTNLSPPKNP
jgi:hypothetical protein